MSLVFLISESSLMMMRSMLCNCQYKRGKDTAIERCLERSLPAASNYNNYYLLITYKQKAGFLHIKLPHTLCIM